MILVAYMVCSVIIVASSLHGEHINTYYIMRSLWRSLYICYVLFAGDAHHQHHNHNHTSYTKYMCARQYLTSVCVCVCVCVQLAQSKDFPCVYSVYTPHKGDDIILSLVKTYIKTSQWEIIHQWASFQVSRRGRSAHRAPYWN